MREIIFRGKRIDNGEWVYGNLVKGTDIFDEVKAYILPVITVFSRTHSGKCASIGNFYEVNIETIGQYTGLLDKNGKKIFEGDIVEFEDAHADCYGYHDNIFINTSDIIYSNGGFSIHGAQVVTMDDLVYKGKFDGNVIGNIYDNPELKAMIFTAN